MNLEDKTNKYIQNQLEKNEEYQRSNNIFSAIKDKQEEQYQNQVELQKKQKFNDLDNLVSLINNAYETKINFKKLNDEFIKKEQKIKHDMINFKNPDALIKSITELKELENQYQIAKQTGEMIYDINSDKLNIQHKAKAMKNMYEFEAKNEVINNKFYNKIIENQDYSYVDNPYEEAFALSNNLAELSNTINNGSYSHTKAFLYGLGRSWRSAKVGLYNILNKVSLLEDKTLAKSVKEFQNVARDYGYIPLITESDDFFSVISSPEKIMSVVAESGGEVIRNIGELAIGGALLKGTMFLAGNTIKGMSLGRYLNNIETYTNTLRKSGLATEAKHIENALGNGLSAIRQMSYNAMNNSNIRSLIGMSLLEGSLRSAEFASSRSTDGTLDVKLSDFLYGTLYGALSGTGTLAMFQKNPLSNQIFKNGLRSPIKSTALGLGSVGFAGTVEGLTEGGQSVLENLAKYSDREYITAKEKSDIYHEIMQSGQLGAIAGGAIKSTFGLAYSLATDVKKASDSLIRRGINKDNFGTITKDRFEDYAILDKGEIINDLDNTVSQINLPLKDKNNLKNRFNDMHTQLLKQMQKIINAFGSYDFDDYVKLFDKIDNTPIEDIKYNTFNKKDITLLNQMYDDISNGRITKYQQMQNIEARRALLKEVSKDPTLLQEFINNEEVTPKNFNSLSAEEIESKFETVRKALSSKRTNEEIDRQNQINEVNNIGKYDGESFSQEPNSQKLGLDKDNIVEDSYIKQKYDNASLMGLMYLKYRNPQANDIKAVLDQINKRGQEFEELKKSGQDLQTKISKASENIFKRKISLKQLNEMLVNNSRLKKADPTNVKTGDQVIASIFKPLIKDGIENFFKNDPVYKAMGESYASNGKENIYNEIIKKRIKDLEELDNTKFLYSRDEIKKQGKNINDFMLFSNSYLDLKTLNKYADIFSHIIEFEGNSDNFTKPNALFKINANNVNIDSTKFPLFNRYLEANENTLDNSTIAFIKSFQATDIIDLLNKNNIDESVLALKNYISAMSKNYDELFYHLQSEANKATQLLLDDDKTVQNQGARNLEALQKVLYDIEKDIKQYVQVLPAKQESVDQYLKRIYNLVQRLFQKAIDLFNTIIFQKMNKKDNKEISEQQKQELVNTLYTLKELILTIDKSFKGLSENVNDTYKEKTGSDITIDLKGDITMKISDFSLLKSINETVRNAFGLDEKQMFKIMVSFFNKLTKDNMLNSKNYNSYSTAIRYLVSNTSLGDKLNEDYDLINNVGLLKSNEILQQLYINNRHFIDFALTSYMETIRELSTNDNMHITKGVKYNEYGNTVNKILIDANSFTDVYKQKINKFYKYKNEKDPYDKAELTKIGLEVANLFFGRIQNIKNVSKDGNIQESYHNLVQVHFDYKSIEELSNSNNPVEYFSSYKGGRNNKYYLLDPILWDKRQSPFFQHLSEPLKELFTYDNESKSVNLPTSTPQKHINPVLNMYNGLGVEINIQGFDTLKNIIPKNAKYIRVAEEGEIIDEETMKNGDITVYDLLDNVSVKYPDKNGNLITYKIDGNIIRKLLSDENFNKNAIDEINRSDIGKNRTNINNLAKYVLLYAIHNKDITVDNNPFFDENSNPKTIYFEHEFTNAGRVQLKGQIFNVQTNKYLRGLFTKNFDTLINDIQLDDNREVVIGLNGSNLKINVKNILPSGIQLLYGEDIDDFLKKPVEFYELPNGEKYKLEDISKALYRVLFRGLNNTVTKTENGKKVQKQQRIIATQKDISIVKGLIELAKKNKEKEFKDLGESPLSELNLFNGFISLEENINKDYKDINHEDIVKQFKKFFNNLDVKADGKTTGFAQKAILQSNNIINSEFSSYSGILRDGINKIDGDAYRNFGGYLLGIYDKEDPNKLVHKGLIHLPYFKNLTMFKVIDNFTKTSSDREAFRSYLKKTTQPIMYQASSIKAYSNLLKALFDEISYDLFMLNKGETNLGRNATFGTFLYGSKSVTKDQLLALIDNDNFIFEDNKKEAIKEIVKKVFSKHEKIEVTDELLKKNLNILSNILYKKIKNVVDDDIRTFTFNANLSLNHFHNLGKLQNQIDDLDTKIIDAKKAIYNEFKKLNADFLGDEDKIDTVEISQFNPYRRIAYLKQSRKNDNGIRYLINQTNAKEKDLKIVNREAYNKIKEMYDNILVLNNMRTNSLTTSRNLKILVSRIYNHFTQYAIANKPSLDQSNFFKDSFAKAKLVITKNGIREYLTYNDILDKYNDSNALNNYLDIFHKDLTPKERQQYQLNRLDDNKIRDFIETPLVNSKHISSLLKKSVESVVESLLYTELQNTDGSIEDVKKTFIKVFDKLHIAIGNNKYIPVNNDPKWNEIANSVRKLLHNIGEDKNIFTDKVTITTYMNSKNTHMFSNTGQFSYIPVFLQSVAPLIEHTFEGDNMYKAIESVKVLALSQMYDAGQINLLALEEFANNWNKNLAKLQSYNLALIPYNIIGNYFLPKYEKIDKLEGERLLFKNLKTNTLEELAINNQINDDFIENNQQLIDTIDMFNNKEFNTVKELFNASNALQIVSDNTNTGLDLNPNLISAVSNVNFYMGKAQTVDVDELLEASVSNTRAVYNLLSIGLRNEDGNLLLRDYDSFKGNEVKQKSIKESSNKYKNDVEKYKYLSSFENTNTKSPETYNTIIDQSVFNEENNEDTLIYNEGIETQPEKIEFTLDGSEEEETDIETETNVNETNNDEIKNDKQEDTVKDINEDINEEVNTHLETFKQYEDSNEILVDINESKPLDTNAIMNNINQDLKHSSESHKNAIMSFLPDALNNISAFSYVLNTRLNEKGGSFIADTQTHRGYITINDNVDHMTLLHEVIHAISYWGENANTNEVININQKISNIKNKIFYHLRNNPKEMYKAGIENLDRLHYIFNTRSNNGLNNQEFLAYFLSNSQAFDYINNLSIRYERNFARKIINFFSNLVQALIKGDLTAIRTGLYGDKLIGLVRDLNRYSDPNNLPKNRLAKYFEYHDKVDQALSNLLKSAFNRDKDLPNEEKNEIYQTFLNNFRIHRLNGLFTPMIFTSGLYRKALYSYIGEIMLTIDHPITNQIVKLGMDFNLLIDGNNSLKLIKDLVNKITSRRVGLEANKQRESEASRNGYNYLFKDFPINEEEDKAIGRIAMSGISDIIRSSIVQMTKDGKLDKDKIDKFVESDLNLLKSIFENIDNREYMVNTINGAVGNKLKQMRDYHGYSDNLANYIENAIFELGSFRAYGGSTYSGYTNARQLYNDLFDPKAMQDIGLKYNTNMIKNGTNFIANANQISALDALSKIITDDDLYESFKTLNKYIANDPNKRNLVLTAMLMLGNQNDRIKNIAKGKGSRASDRFLYNNSHDGYMPNINNPEVDVQTVTTNEEAKELYDLGYRILNVKGSVAKQIDKLEDINKSEHANTTKNNEAKYFIMRRVSSISLNDRYIKGTKYQGFVAKGILFNTNNDLPYDEFVKYSQQKEEERKYHRTQMAKKKWEDMKQNRVTTSEYEAILGTKKYRLLPSKKMNESIFLNNVKGSDIAYELTASYYDKKQRHELTNKFYTLLIKDAKTYHDRNLKGSTTKHYVNILNDDGTIPDNKVNAFLSAEDRYYLTKMMKNNGLKHLYVNKFLIPEMFGYNDRNLNNHVSNKHPFLKKSLAVLQKGLSLFLKEYKANVIIRTPEVVTTNLISNYTTLYLKGLSLKEIESYTYQAYSELNMILDNAKEIANLNAKLDKINSTPHILTDEESNEKYRLSKLIQSLQDQIVTSPVYPLFEGGLYTNIVEDDINDAGNIDYQFIAKVSKFMSTNKNKEEMLSNILHNGLFTSKSVLYDIGTTVTRFADFGGRYALYKHLITKGESIENAIKEAREVFIDYNAPTYSGILNFMNKYGLSAFSRYWSGIQKTIANVSIDNPLRALEIAFLQFYLMPSETISILGDNILNRNLPLLLGNPDLSKIGNNMFRWNGVLNYI